MSKVALQIAYAAVTAVPLVAHVYPLPVYSHMMLMTLLTLYLGCHHSVKSTDASLPQAETETLSRKDAWMFPVLGSVMLLSLYAVFKYLPEEYVQLAVKAYFFVVGNLALATSLSVVFQICLPAGVFQGLTALAWTVPVPRMLKNQFATAPDAGAGFWAGVKVTFVDVLALLLSVALGVLYLQTELWSLSNLFGVAFSLQAISMISLGSTQNGLIVLWGLFIYDITWVFGSDVMVTVAKKFNAPIKLLFPKANGERPSMLGLGDIVIPGLFLALMLRLDYFLAEKKRRDAGGNSNSVTSSDSFPKPYFWSAMLGYFLGLSVTVAIMYYFDHAQPALLYLVPFICVAVLICAIVRGEVSAWYNFTEEAEEKKGEEKKEEKVAKKIK